jgi:hypothetical protein
MEFSRWQLFRVLAAIVCTVGIVSLALIYFFPAPPSKVVMATAFKGASFEYYGRRYREIFARYHIDLELRETAEAVEAANCGGLFRKRMEKGPPGVSAAAIPSVIRRKWGHPSWVIRRLMHTTSV